MKNRVIYQIGVDILGFPIYLEHNTVEVKSRDVFAKKNKTKL